MKSIIVSFAFLLTLEFCYSQAVFGVKGGTNLNEVVVENAPSLPTHIYDASIGFHVGVSCQLTIAEKFTINPELQFIQKGGNSEDIRINLNYLELPLLLSYKPIKILSIEVGPSFAYLLSAAESPNDGAPDVSDVFDKPLDVGLTGGIKINLNDKVSLISRYYYGFNSVRSFPTTYPDTNPTSSNRNFQFGVSYSFNKKNSS